MYEQLQQLDTIRINFTADGMHIINIVLGLVMFGVALNIKPSLFKRVLTHPKSVILGVVSQIIILPAVTFLLIMLFNRFLSPMVAMGMLLVAACPGGNISNFMSAISKGNIELSVTLTAISTAICPLATPANFAFWGWLYVRLVNNGAIGALQELQIDTVAMFESMMLLLALPLALGMLTAHYLPKVTEKIKKAFQILSIIFFVLMVVLAFSNNFDLFIKYIGYIAIIVFVHNGCALATGYGLGTFFRLPHPDRRSLTVEIGIQNSGLGLVLLFNPKIFPPDLAIGGMLFVTAWWGVWHILSGLAVSGWFAARSKRAV
ncbi:MAG: bile acid:sodium symporter family protein [Prevotellaceae bacterium]|jgi:BASS family bile acid:Na+ symporter|nr:bile acid:sodium symporter family protein [Prevotellaceae bacterium]